MKKFNIAFIPVEKNDDFISICLDRSENITTHGYMIGMRSIPHVTICQFFSEDSVENIIEKIEPIACDILTLSFNKFSHITFGNGVYWVSLLPQQTDLLREVFNNISMVVGSLRTDAYDPHLTLYNYSSMNGEGIAKKTKNFEEIFIEDQFQLVLGESDSLGQLTDVIARFNKLTIKNTL